MNKCIALCAALVVLLLTFGLLPANAIAAADATCISDPPRGPVGTDFVITCTGYTPNSTVYAYMVEPSGAAHELVAYTENGTVIADIRGQRVNEAGIFAYVQKSFFGNNAIATGTWHFVVEELAPGHAVLHRGETSFIVTGGTEGVGGAALSAEPSLLRKPLKSWETVGNRVTNFANPVLSEPATVSGSGFAPGESVTFWVEAPNGGCSTFLAHEEKDLATFPPDVVSIAHIKDSYIIYGGKGAMWLTDVKADNNGGAAIQFSVPASVCEGGWHFVARGNTSGRGGDTIVTIVGNAIGTNAQLTADPTFVSGMYGRVNFVGTGFGPHEPMSCWLATPRGQVLAYPDLSYDFELPTASLDTTPIKSDGAGNIAFELLTGGIYYFDKGTIVIGGVPIDTHAQYSRHLASEGPLGEYAMTCRGNVSQATAIARFIVTGGFIDP